jgi:hypothetical protein
MFTVIWSLLCKWVWIPETTWDLPHRRVYTKTLNLFRRLLRYVVCGFFFYVQVFCFVLVGDRQTYVYMPLMMVNDLPIFIGLLQSLLLKVDSMITFPVPQWIFYDTWDVPKCDVYRYCLSTLSVSDVCYSRNASCALNLIYTFLLMQDVHLILKPNLFAIEINKILILHQGFTCLFSQ